MPPERPRPDFEQVREAMRERDERAEAEERDAPAPAPDRGDDQEDAGERDDGS